MSKRRGEPSRPIPHDPRVDTVERNIEQFVIRLIALRQPMAGDLRLIIGGLKVSDDLERIGDALCVGFAIFGCVLQKFAQGHG